VFSNFGAGARNALAAPESGQRILTPDLRLLLRIETVETARRGCSRSRPTSGRRLHLRSCKLALNTPIRYQPYECDEGI
jgi:hypothetical protein